MSRFSITLQSLHDEVSSLERKLDESEASKFLYDEVAATLRRILREPVYHLRDQLDQNDSFDLVITWMKLENRTVRSIRLADLQAPKIFLQNELRWVRTMVEHFSLWADGIEPVYTEDEIEELENSDVDTGVDDEVILLDQIKGALYGFAIGDALGATTEFMMPDEIQRKHGRITEFLGGGWLSLEPGETTDDTAMTLCVAEGILDSPRDPIDSIGRLFLHWQATHPPDIGVTVRHALAAYQGDWARAAKKTHLELGGKSAGNGTLMRCLPVALAYPDLQKMEDITVRQSKMTHFDDLASEACLIYNRIAHRVLNGENLRVAMVLETEETPYRNTFLQRPTARPDGFVVNTLTWVFYLLWTYPTFAEVVQQAANEGYDSDTVGAIAGGLKGLATGHGPLSDWGNKLKGADRLNYVAKKLLELRMSQLA